MQRSRWIRRVLCIKLDQAERILQAAVIQAVRLKSMLGTHPECLNYEAEFRRRVAALSKQLFAVSTGLGRRREKYGGDLAELAQESFADASRRLKSIPEQPFSEALNIVIQVGGALESQLGPILGEEAYKHLPYLLRAMNDSGPSAEAGTPPDM